MPSNFAWFTEHQIAGMERPGSYHPLEEDLAFLKSHGIEVIISLTIAPLERKGFERFDFEVFHIPVPDGEAPGIPEIERFVNYVNYWLSNRKKIVVHCGAGYGRTGTMIACYLVSLGHRAGRAIAEVRRRVQPAIENAAQEKRVAEYERYLREKGRGRCETANG